MEIDETDNICFICDKKISSDKWKYKLQVTATTKRNLPAEDLIKHLVGEEYAVLVGERDAVCSKCMNLLNLMDTLTFQLEEVTAVLTKLLHSKYNLTSDINSFQVDYDTSIVEKSEPLHSCSKCSFKTKYEKEFNKHVQTHSVSRTSPTKKPQPTKTKSSSKTKSLKKPPVSTPAKQEKIAEKQVIKPTTLFNPSRTVTRSSTNSLKRKRRYSDSSDDKPVIKKTANTKTPAKKTPVKKSPKPKKSKVLFQCSACDKTFPSETLIQAHAEKEHGIARISVTEEEYADIQTLESSDDEVTVVAKGKAKMTNSKKTLPVISKLDFLDDWDEDENDEITSPNKKSNVDKKVVRKSAETKKKSNVRTREKLIDLEVDEDEKDTTSSPTCLFCHATFSSLEAVQDHIKMFHNRPKTSKAMSKPANPDNEGSFEIDSTTEILDTKSSGGKNHLASKCYKCNLCGIKKVSLQFIQKHVKNHKWRMSLQCKNCTFTCRNVVGLKLHASRCHKVACIPKKCNFCKFKFLTRNQLANHVKKVHVRSKSVKKYMTDSALMNSITSNDSAGQVIEKLDNRKGNLTSATDSRKISSSEVSSTSFETERLNKKDEIHNTGTECQEKKFKCGECSKSFDRPSILKVHTSRHRASKCTSLGICVYCNKLFLSREQVLLHTSVIHQDLKESPFCEVCGKSYSYMKDLKTHYIKSHWTDLTEILVTQAMQQKRMKSRPRKRKGEESNDVYNKVFKELQDLTGEGNDTDDVTAERYEHSPLFYSCPLCNYASRLEEEVKSHLKSHKKNYCNICKSIFSCQELIKHLENHSVLFQSKKCFECKGKFHDSVHLQFHLNHDHPGNKPFKCSMCTNSYCTAKSLMNHKQKKHAKKAVRVFPCSWCEKKFLTNKLYQVHIEYGHRSNLNCKYCDKAFGVVKTLISHEKNHLKQVKSIYKCHICGKVLKNLASLKSHKLNHAWSTSSLQCEVCSKGFKSFHTLREHSAKHTGTHELKYFCDICGKGFYFYDSHYRHRRIHLEPVCLQCKKCEESFPDSDSLQEHKKVCTAT